MKKTLIVIVLSCLLLGLFCVPASAAYRGYSDISGHWAEDVIKEWSGLEVINGYPDGTFRPDGSITRGEMATILDRIFQFQGVSENPFRDLDPNEWCADAVLKCNRRGILLGYNGLVRPYDTITREEAAAVVARSLGYYGKTTDYKTAYADSSSISDWAYQNVAWLTEHGYITDSPTNYRAKEAITRAETMVLLDNMIDTIWDYTGLYNEDFEGNLLVRASKFMLINSHIKGDVIIPCGANEKIILCNCQIDGEVLNPAGANVQVTDENGVDTVIALGQEHLVQPGARVNRLRGNDFYFDEKERMQYSGGYVAHGIDVSSWNGDIDWEKVAADGIDFAIIRCAYRGYSAGNLMTDEMFYNYMDGAIAAGLDVGVYVYSSAINEEEARQEARKALSMVQGYDLAYPIFYDWEKVKDDVYGSRTEYPSPYLTDFAVAFCEEVESNGYTAGVYSYPSLAYDNYNLAQLNDYYMWMAVYFDKPEYYYHYDMCQYTSSGSVNGIEGRVDMNLSFVEF
ncbi:MAG: S-layer homology domain-containing protein [Firmicutes bacterium]|nr:S-layer homology domain-containing protein [Bacillota bacterium]